MNNQKQESLDQLELENKHLRQQIEDLQSELYKLRLKAHGGAAGVDALVEKADETRQELEAQLNAQAVLLDGCFPYELFDPPELSGETQNTTRPIIRGGKPLTFDECSLVAYRIFIRNSTDPRKTECYRGHALYPGTAEQARAELKANVDAIIRRTPLPGSRGNAGLHIPEVILTDVMLQLSPYRYIEKLKEQFNEKLKELFNTTIYPAIKDNPETTKLTEGELYDRVRKTVIRRFENMEKERTGFQD